MDRCAIVLAGGASSRFGRDKGLMALAGKPLIKHVLDIVSGIVEEKIVVVNSQIQAENYMTKLNSEVTIVADQGKVHTPLFGALTGLSVANGECEYALLLPCDTPFISQEIALLLFETCISRNAAIPRWPNGYIEPLQAVYFIKPALEAAKRAFHAGYRDMKSMITELHGIRYVSTLVLQQLDTELLTFFNVNTPLDLKKAESIHKRWRR